MKPEYVVVYRYMALGSLHRIAIEQNYWSHVINNPDALVIPVSVRGEEWIPGTVFVGDWMDSWVKNLYKPSNILLFSDYIFLSYLRSPRCIPAKKYVSVDWDTYSHRGSLKELLQDVWGSDVGGSRVRPCCGLDPLFWCGGWCGCVDSILAFEDSSVFLLDGEAAPVIARADPESICPGFSQAHGSVRIPTIAGHLGYRVRGSDMLSRGLKQDANYNFQDTPAIYQSVRTPLVGVYNVPNERRDTRIEESVPGDSFASCV